MLHQPRGADGGDADFFAPVLFFINADESLFL